MLRALHLLFGFCCRKSTSGPFGPVAERIPRRSSLEGSGVRRWSPPLLAIVAVLVVPRLSEAQLIESFDEGRPRFQLWKHDARATLSRPPKSEPGIEAIEIQSGNGSFIYLAYPIDPCGIIPELNGTIRIRSAERGYRMGFRVVFPHARHPATHEPLTEVILGTAHDGAGRWSTSSISEVVPKLEERQRYLRQRDGPDVDLREPYIDAVILSVYGYPGVSRIQIDDLVVDGMIAPGMVVAEGSAMESISEVIPTSERLRVLQAKVPRWIQHQGESVAYLQSLGFNSVITQQTQDTLVLDQAAETDMGVIMPPPLSAPAGRQADRYRPVSAWLVGIVTESSASRGGAISSCWTLSLASVVGSSHRRGGVGVVRILQPTERLDFGPYAFGDNRSIQSRGCGNLEVRSSTDRGSSNPYHLLVDTDAQRMDRSASNGLADLGA